MMKTTVANMMGPTRRCKQQRDCGNTTTTTETPAASTSLIKMGRLGADNHSKLDNYVVT